MWKTNQQMTHGFSAFTCWTEGHTELLQEALLLLLLPPPPLLDVAWCIPQRFPLCWCRLSPALSLHPSASQSASQPPAPSFIPNPSLSKEPTQKKPQSSWQMSWSCSSRLHIVHLYLWDIEENSDKSEALLVVDQQACWPFILHVMHFDISNYWSVHRGCCVNTVMYVCLYVCSAFYCEWK